MMTKNKFVFSIFILLFAACSKNEYVIPAATDEFSHVSSTFFNSTNGTHSTQVKFTSTKSLNRGNFRLDDLANVISYNIVFAQFTASLNIVTRNTVSVNLIYVRDNGIQDNIRISTM